MKKLSPMQVQFLLFSVNHTVYGFNGSPNPGLPCKGAVAKTINDSLRKRALINGDGMITPLGRATLNHEVGLGPPQAA